MPKIMLVEDQPVIRELVKRLLVATGLDDIVDFATGEDAWEFLASPASDGVDVLVTDIELTGMSGIELVWLMRASPFQRLHGLPVLVLSGRIDDRVKKQLVPLRVDGCILKPVTAGELRSALDRTLGYRAPHLIAM